MSLNCSRIKTEIAIVNEETVNSTVLKAKQYNASENENKRENTLLSINDENIMDRTWIPYNEGSFGFTNIQTIMIKDFCRTPLNLLK